MPYRPRASQPPQRVALYHSAEWRRERAAQLAAETHCRMCGAPARVADHVVPLRYGGTVLQSLCARCHQVKRATLDQGHPLRQRGQGGGSGVPATKFLRERPGRAPILHQFGGTL